MKIIKAWLRSKKVAQNFMRMGVFYNWFMAWNLNNISFEYLNLTHKNKKKYV